MKKLIIIALILISSVLLTSCFESEEERKQRISNEWLDELNIFNN